jgi:hypothetical protein
VTKRIASPPTNIMPNPVRHTRPVPAEWPELAAHAERVIPPRVLPGRNIKRRHLFKLFRHAFTLPNERLETNYYYGLGEIMCGMAKLLQREDVRNTVIHDAAASMVKAALQRRGQAIPLGKPFVPIMDDLLQQSMEQPFFMVAHASWRAMLVPCRALTDILATAAIYRRQEAHGMLKVPRPLARIMSVEAARDLRPAAYQIARNSLTAATSVLGILLTNTDLMKNPSRELLAKPIQFSALERARHSKGFIGAAQLRDDEFVHGAGWRRDGELPQFDADVLAAPPSPLRSALTPGHAHESRLTCPAVQAGGLAHDVARNILPAIIVASGRIVPGNIRCNTHTPASVHYWLKGFCGPA